MTALAAVRVRTSLGAKAGAAKARFEATGGRRAQAPEWLLDVLACLVGLATFVALWALIARFGGRIPDPVTVWSAAAKIFAHPFYSKGPNDQGIGWNVLSSLRRVGIGFGLAALVGIPLRFLIGRWRFFSGLSRRRTSVIQTVSTRARLPIGS